MKVRIYSTTSYQEVVKGPEQNKRVNVLRFSLDQLVLYVATEDSVLVWDMTTGKTIYTYEDIENAEEILFSLSEENNEKQSEKSLR